MSLISEALKEAQRERSERTGPRSGTRSPATVGESFFPYPNQTRKRAQPRRGFIIGVSVIAVVAVGGAVTLRLLATRPPAHPVPTAAPVASVTPAPAIVAKNVSAVAPASLDSSKRSLPDAKTPVVAPRSTAHDGRVDAPAKSVASAESPKAARTTEPVVAPAKKVDSIAPTPTAPPPAAPAASKSSALRVVVEPASQRPGDSLFVRAFAEHSRGNLDAAADLYEKAIAHPPVAPELYNDYGALLAGRGKHTAAITMYNLGISANDHDARLWTNLGDSYRAVGRRADAMSAYFEAAKLDPSNIAVKLRLAAEYAAIGDTASARRGYEEAVRVAPRDPDAHYAFGSFLQAQHDYRGAARELQAFVDNASGRYSQDVIERTKAYVSNLRRQYP